MHVISKPRLTAFGHKHPDALEALLAWHKLMERHAIANFAELRSLFGSVDLVGDWNAQHPELPMAFMYARSDWPMFHAWGTPTFYFFRDGKLDQTVEGWPEEGRRDALIEAATRVGLLEPP